MANAKAMARNLLLAVILVPLLMLGGYLVTSSVVTLLDGGCVAVGAKAQLCLHTF